MKIRMKVDALWLELERKYMRKLLEQYRQWESQTLEKVRQARDLRTLREFFYELGERWEWDQVTGDWLAHGEPLDAVAFMLRVPSLHPDRDRYVLYAVMAYSKGVTDQFDHLGDKERVILERDTRTGKLYVWSTTGHGAVDLFPADLTPLGSIDEVLRQCHLIAQPGDHALRLVPPLSDKRFWSLHQRLWDIASGTTSFTWKTIDVLTPDEIEERMDFKFYRFAKAVIDLENAWRELQMTVSERVREVAADEIPDAVERRNRRTLRRVEGLLHVLWFQPPVRGLLPARLLYEELRNDDDLTNVEKNILPRLGELVYALNDVIEKAKYLKWKSVVEAQGQVESSIFDGLDISPLAREAVVVALDDILKEHTLAYVAYPERDTMVGKAMRISFGVLVLPLRILSAFLTVVSRRARQILSRFRSSPESPSDSTEESAVAEE